MSQTIDADEILTEMDHIRQSLAMTVPDMMNELTNEQKRIKNKLAALKVLSRELKKLDNVIKAVAKAPSANTLRYVISQTREMQKQMDRVDSFQPDDDDDMSDDEMTEFQAHKKRKRKSSSHKRKSSSSS
jgi:hypothetical protein